MLPYYGAHLRSLLLQAFCTAFRGLCWSCISLHKCLISIASLSMVFFRTYSTLAHVESRNITPVRCRTTKENRKLERPVFSFLFLSHRFLMKRDGMLVSRPCWISRRTPEYPRTLWSSSISACQLFIFV